METYRQTYPTERTVLGLLALEIAKPRTTGDARVDAVPEAIRLFPHFCTEPHPHALDAAATLRHARDLLLRGDHAGARRLLATLALAYRRYACIFALAGRADLVRSFEFLAAHLAEATRVLGSDMAPDGWRPALDEQPLDDGESPDVLAEKRIEVTLDGERTLAVFVQVRERATSAHAFHLEVVIGAPDPARTQVAFDVLVNDRRETLAVARRWAAIGTAMVKAAMDPPVLLVHAS